ILVLADIVGTFHLAVSDVSDAARGGAVVFGLSGEDEVVPFTNGLRGGETSFDIAVGGRPQAPPPLPKPIHDTLPPPAPEPIATETAVAVLVTLLTGLNSALAADATGAGEAPGNNTVADVGNLA